MSLKIFSGNSGIPIDHQEGMATNYTIENLDTYDTPFLAVYPDKIRRNIDLLISMFGSKNQVRPHVKTHKCPEVVRLFIVAGITKFKCATVAEAEMLAINGAEDILIAYQPVGPKIDRFINLMLQYPASRFSCLVDHITSATQISDAASDSGVMAEVWIDLNVGMDRTGIVPGDEVIKLFHRCSSLNNIKILGLHAYDGHLTEPNEKVRLARAEAGFNTVRNLVSELEYSGFDTPRIVAGSTPTIRFYAKHPDVECSPGTCVYWDRHYQDSFPELGFEAAAAVVTRVISKPHTETACLDLGYKSVSSEGKPDERIWMPELPEAMVISQSEEHLLVSGTPKLQVGDAVYGLPYHIGRTCNLYEGCAVVEQRQIVSRWNHTARSRHINI
ncbi:hypothetical protein ASE55_13250 [Chryseobacterium sp. Leaf201]|nr:hypothetical protein ASE55_13250 [Chryseobacterium sp. Leaf201]